MTMKCHFFQELLECEICGCQKTVAYTCMLIEVSQGILTTSTFHVSLPVKHLLPSPSGSSDEVSLEQESEEDIHSSRSSLDRQSHHRANTTMHVCWYRNTSVSMTDHSVAVEVSSSTERIAFSIAALFLVCCFSALYLCMQFQPPITAFNYYVKVIQ